MGHDESQARQAVLVKFVRLMKASANDVASEVEAISFTGDIASLTNYELSVVVGQLQAQLFSNLNPHRPSGITEPAPEPTPATPAVPASVVEIAPEMNLSESLEYASNQVQNLRERMEQGDRELYRSVGEFMDSTNSTIQNLAAEALEPEPAPTPAPKRLSLYSLFQEVGQDYDKLYDELKYYTKPALVRVARQYKLAGKTALEKYKTVQLIEELVQFVKNQRESWGTPTPEWEPTPAPTPATRVQKTRKPQRGEPADWKTQHLVVQGVVVGEPAPGLSWLDNPEAFTL